MNYNDIKNLNISKRGKKELLNALNESGNGVSIVDSIDKLDNNAPAGSLAVVAQQGTSDTKKPYDLYQLDIENDCLIDQENYTIEILYPEKLSKVKNVDFNIPQVTVYGENPSTLVIGTLSFFNIMSGAGDPSNPDLSNTIGVIIGFTVKNNVVDKVEVNVIIKGETYIFNIMSYVDNKYVINQVDLKNLQQVVETIDEDIYYFFDMYSTMTGSQEKYVDEFVLLNSGTSSKAELFIKKDQWEDPYKNKFNSIQAEINTKQNPITIISPSGNNYFELSPGKFYKINNISEDTTLKLLEYEDNRYSGNYKEYLFEFTITTNPINITFIDNNDNPIVIKWANQIELSLESEYVYLISIVEKFGVFLKF